MKLTAAQTAVIAELIRQGYQAGQVVRPHEVFPARTNAAAAQRRTLEAVGRRFGLRHEPDWSTSFVLTQEVFDAVQD
jgi:hypothetical protein